MFRLSFLAFWALVAVGEAALTWNSPQCQALQKQDASVSESCVKPGTVRSASPACNHCLFNEHCASKWCWDAMKVCYDSALGGCYMGGDYTANCNNCPSDPSTNQAECSCENSKFPDNWVECTDGSGGFLKSGAASGSNTYTPKLSSSGGLAADDKFAIVIQCYHNKVREAAGLQPLDWDDGLAKFAKTWSEKLCRELNCGLKHSSSSDRGFSAGENLYASWSSSPLPVTGTPNAGKSALEAWYKEIKDYYYAGPDQPYKKGCAQTGVVGHFTQVMWTNTKKLGCGFAYSSDGNSIEITCNYDPPGNYVSQAAFDKDAYCKLANWKENKETYGEIHWCGSASPC